MREIKFRGKAECGIEELEEQGFEHENGWIYGTYLDGYIVNGVVESTDEYIALEEWYPVKIETVGQCTGLKDKNGKEIYEGDVVRIDDLGIGIVDYEEGRFAMRRREERFCWPVYCRIDHSPFVPEVIGNIHDNPELLEAV